MDLLKSVPHSQASIVRRYPKKGHLDVVPEMWRTKDPHQECARSRRQDIGQNLFGQERHPFLSLLRSRQDSSISLSGRKDWHAHSGERLRNRLRKVLHHAKVDPVA